MNFSLPGVSVCLTCLIIISACSKEKKTPATTQQTSRVIVKTIRDFTKGVATVKYSDSTETTYAIPIDTLDSRKLKSVQGNGRLLDDPVYDDHDYESEESENAAPIVDPIDGSVMYPNPGLPDYYGYAGPSIWTRPHAYVIKVDGLIQGVISPWVEITRNQNVNFLWRGYNVNRTATVMGLIFIPGVTQVPVTICTWEYYINFYFTYSYPYGPPQTRQESYYDIRYVR